MEKTLEKTIELTRLITIEKLEEVIEDINSGKVVFGRILSSDGVTITTTPIGFNLEDKLNRGKWSLVARELRVELNEYLF